MGLLSNLFGTPRAAGDVINSVSDGIRSVRNTFSRTLDTETQAEVNAELSRIQNEVNKVEAGHPSLFVAGWRPAIGWVCAIGLFYHWIVYRIMSAFLPDLPQLDPEGLLSLTLGLLGMAGLRTYEKVRGAQRNH